jgi:DNA-binding response OmpR family regulator
MTHIRITVIDDDERLAQQIKEAFEEKGYQVDVFYDALHFFRHIEAHGLPNLALVDILLPSTHGFEVSKKLKALGDVPIVFISNEDEQEMIIDGIERFADDYVTKPFDIRELVARVRRILSRIAHADYVQQPVIQIDKRLSIDFSQSRLLIDGQAVLLTPTEINLLYLLVQNANQVVPSQILIDRVWPIDDVYEDTLRVHMHRLRRKLEVDYRKPKYILTERGTGYCFVMEKSSES